MIFLQRLILNICEESSIEIWVIYNITNFSEEGAEENMEAHEVIDDQLTRQMTREYMDFLS